LAISQFGAFFTCSSDIIEAPSVALCAFKMSGKLLNAHSKYGGSCSILSYRRELRRRLAPGKLVSPIAGGNTVVGLLAEIEVIETQAMLDPRQVGWLEGGNSLGEATRLLASSQRLRPASR
jgi:hypothetical protein